MQAGKEAVTVRGASEQATHPVFPIEVLPREPVPHPSQPCTFWDMERRAAA